ncbi:MAG: superoxide dismutase, Fe-Mn family, partial [Parcubacteria group bacterium Gr01-1014_91]
LRRRFAFEFDGMRMHELYFEQLRRSEIGAPTEASGFDKAVSEKYGNREDLVAHIREVASSRGIGWVVVCKDADTIHTTFVNDHEVGQLAGLPILLALDLWEHAYMVDYVPAEKKNYIDAFFANVNWSVVEKRFDQAK